MSKKMMKMKKKKIIKIKKNLKKILLNHQNKKNKFLQTENVYILNFRK